MKGLTTISSHFSVKETIDRLALTLQSNNWNVFARIDHAAHALKKGLHLRPTELIIFGNPQIGTLLMQDQQTIGIDLPVKALAWQDESDKVWLSYTEISWLKDKHKLSDKSQPAINAIETSIIQACTTAAEG